MRSHLECSECGGRYTRFQAALMAGACICGGNLSAVKDIQREPLEYPTLTDSEITLLGTLSERSAVEMVGT